MMKNRISLNLRMLLIMTFVILLSASMNCSNDEDTTVDTVGTPIFDIAVGTYNADQSVVISTETAGAVIYYTTDGTDPTGASTEYTAAVSVAGHGTAMTIKAIAIKSDMNDSSIAEAAYTINYDAVSMPVFSQVTGTYNTNLSVTIDVSTPIGATVIYTIDGSTPAADTDCNITNGIAIASGDSVAITTTDLTLNAIGCKTTWANSSVSSAVYTIQTLPPEYASGATVGTYTSGQTIDLSSSTAATTIYYTTDGSTPVCGSGLSGVADSSTATVLLSTSGVYDVNAIACLAGWTASTVALIGTYTITGTVSDPVYGTPGGTFTNVPVDVTITVTNPASATVIYTTDNSTPTADAGCNATNGTAVASGTSVSVGNAGSTTLIAIGCNLDWITSSPVTQIYSVMPGFASELAYGSIRDVAVSGNYAYAVDAVNGLVVIDITDPLSPYQLSALRPTTPVYMQNGMGIYIIATTAYVIDYSGNLFIIDITTPATPTLVGAANIGGSGGYDIFVAGSYAYIANNSLGFQIVDISTPASPTLVGTYAATAKGVFVSGNVAYVGAGYPGLLILDITDPATPTLTGVYNSADAYSVVVSGTTAYLADSWNGLLTIDVSTLASPALVSRYDTPGSAYGIDLVGNLAYVSDSSGGLQIIDVSTPDTPVLAGSYYDADDSAYPYNAVISGSYAYIAGNMFQILQVAP